MIRYATIGLALLMVGCQLQQTSIATKQAPLRVPRGAVANGIEAMGGLTAWREISSVTYQAVVTTYDQQGSAFVNRHEQTLSLADWTLRASATRPEGTWRAKTAPDSQCTFSGTIRPEVQQRLASALPMARHRVCGPLNLIGPDERTGRTRRMRIDGVDLKRVAAKGVDQTASVIAYYFNTNDGLLRLVTSGADAPNKDGLVTVYDFGRHAGNMRFPKKITIFKIGTHALVGTQKVLEIDIQNVVFLH